MVLCHIGKRKGDGVMRRKRITVVMTLCIIVSLLSGCTTKESESIILEDDTEVTEEVVEEETEEITEEVVEEETEVIVEDKITDFSYLYGSSTSIMFSADSEVVTADDGNENEAGYYTYDIKVTDDGSGYLLEVRSIQYKLAIDSVSYSTFIDGAVGTDYEMNEDGDRICALTEDTTLVCLGETFTLTSYIVNDAGRGYCELLGEDGEMYRINNDMSSNIDSFTNLNYFDICSSESEAITREITFEENAILFIPYDTTLEEMFSTYVNGSPDYDSGNPSGVYYIQFDSDGNVLKIVG